MRVAAMAKVLENHRFTRKAGYKDYYVRNLMLDNAAALEVEVIVEDCAQIFVTYGFNRMYAGTMTEKGLDSVLDYLLGIRGIKAISRLARKAAKAEAARYKTVYELTRIEDALRSAVKANTDKETK